MIFDTEINSDNNNNNKKTTETKQRKHNHRETPLGFPDLHLVVGLASLFFFVLLLSTFSCRPSFLMNFNMMPFFIMLRIEGKNTMSNSH